MFFTISAILGGLMNAIRGGILAKYLGSFGKPLHHVVFGSFVYLCGYEVWQAIIAAILIWATNALGWGKYIGAAIDHHVRVEEREIGWIDRLCRPFENDWHTYATITLALRGLIIGLPISLLLLNPYPAFAGASMGIWFILAGYICRWLRVNHGLYAWPLGEVLFGAIFWLSIPLGIGIITQP